MINKKTLIVGLLAATIGGGLLQAESLTYLTFALTSGTGVTFSGGDGTAFTVTSAPVSSVYSNSASEYCPSCTISFGTTLSSFSEGSFGSGNNAFFYGFNANGSPTAFSVQTPGTLNNPGTPPPDSFTGTLASGTIGASPSGSGGFQSGGGSSTLVFSIPVTTGSGLASIFAAFGLTQAAGDGGTLQFTVTSPSGSSPSTGNGGAFTGTISAASLTLDATSIIPEPASVMLIGLGLICVAFVGRKRMLTQRL